MNEEGNTFEPILSSTSPETYDRATSEGYLQEFRPSPKLEPFNPRTIRNMQVITERMGLVLRGLHGGEIPNEEMSKEELKDFCKSLVEGQREDISKFEGSWSVTPIDHHEGMPSDARVDFVYMPTYLSIAILTKVMIDFLEVEKDISGYTESLRKGYEFATSRGLKGHGYEAWATLTKTLELFEKGNVLQFLSGNPEFSPEMYKLMEEIKTEVESRLENGNTRSPWGGDMENRLCEILEKLDGF